MKAFFSQVKMKNILCLSPFSRVKYQSFFGTACKKINPLYLSPKKQRFEGCFFGIFLKIHKMFTIQFSGKTKKPLHI